MKLFLASLLLLTEALSILATNTSTIASTTLKPPGPCPTENELEKVGCECYPDPLYLICDGSSNSLNFNRKYTFNSLVIRNSPRLPFWSENMSHDDDFVVDSLIVLQSNGEVNITDNFSDLLQLPRRAIKIVANGQIKTIDLSNMRRDLISVSVTSVPKLVHGDFSSFNFGEESTLESLRLNTVKFEPALNNLVLNQLPLRVVEIINTDLKGVVSVVPNKCPPEDERVVINLQNNQNLTGFSFEDLFKKRSACHYHIDLSNNPELDKKILIKSYETLKNHGANMFIRIAGLEIDCDCPLLKLYNEKLRNNIHSVHCSGKGFLNLIASDTEKLKAQKCI